jgi:manganese transport protein
MDNRSDLSLNEVHGSIHTSSGRHLPWWKKIFAFLGPAYLVSVGYMDPGNWATDLAGGSKFGYSLIWVLLMSNLMALLLQSLSARLGIVRGMDLAQSNREAYPKWINLCLYVLAEIAIAATDLAEVLGMAIGLHLLTGIPILWGVVITVTDTLLLLFLQRKGMRRMEIFIISLVAVVGFSFLGEIIMAKPDLKEVSLGFIPHIQNNEALYIMIGIIGATVMPHNLYLHSALVQTRKIRRDRWSIKEALKYNFIDSTIALNLAFLVNAAILILAATVFFKTGRTDVARIESAHELLTPLLGNQYASKIFAIALIAAGQSSTITGTLSGQIVMEGYLRLRINPWIRRLMTRLIAIIPAFLVISIYGDQEVDAMLIFSQVLLSLQLGFAVIPLIQFVSDKELMGEFAIGKITKTLAWLVTSILLYLNFRMLAGELAIFINGHPVISVITIIVLTALAFILVYVLIHPLIRKKRRLREISVHSSDYPEINFTKTTYKKIAIALELSGSDRKLIEYALGQGNEQTKYQLIHIVESPSSRILGKESDDYETRKDLEQLQFLKNQLSQKGFETEVSLGFGMRSKEIVRIINECEADILVIGAHGHSGLMDMIYGETIDSVRHALQIPVLVVNIGGLTD